jgi:hypothetical protein
MSSKKMYAIVEKYYDEICLLAVCYSRERAEQLVETCKKQAQSKPRPPPGYYTADSNSEVVVAYVKLYDQWRAAWPFADIEPFHIVADCLVIEEVEIIE